MDYFNEIQLLDIDRFTYRMHKSQAMHIIRYDFSEHSFWYSPRFKHKPSMVRFDEWNEDTLSIH